MVSELHNVVWDPHSNGTPRYTCRSCNDRAVLRQPWMRDAHWQMARELFQKEHPCYEPGKVKGTCKFCGAVREDLLSPEVQFYCTSCHMFQDSVNDQLEKSGTRN